MTNPDTGTRTAAESDAGVRARTEEKLEEASSLTGNLAE